MRRQITIGNKNIDIECNSGTALFFQEFTGLNIYELITKPLAKIKNIDSLKGLKDNPDKLEILNDPETLSKIETSSKLMNEAIEYAQKLTYIMSLQATHNKTLDGISEIRKELNQDDYLAWLMQFDAKDFSFKTYLEITAFWRRQTEGTSEPKN